jgi:3-deoxy-manno-octulosonate cytidylyltransferase (CMP-KDO synthetase)
VGDARKSCDRSGDDSKACQPEEPLAVSRILGVIPARMSSSRFPGKPLMPLLGRPMLAHVFDGAAACPLLDEVVIATCDGQIAEAAAAFGARAVMTSETHERASDRVAEVSALDPADIIVMVQGDEPMIRPEMVTAAVTPLQAQAQVACVNLAAPIRDEDELRDPNTIKVVTTLAGDALFFSRSPIPHEGHRPFVRGIWMKQVCVIAFRRDALQRFAGLPQGPLEIAESVDMLRFLENGIPVHIVATAAVTQAVDTPEDLARVEALMSSAAFSRPLGEPRT